MTQVQAAETWEAQRAAAIKSEVLAEVAQHSQAQQKQAVVKTYEAMIPALADSESGESKRLAGEYKHLVVELGLPNSEATMLAALRATFGPADGLRKMERKGAESFGETGDSAGASNAVEVTKGLKLTPREKDFYDRSIKAGVYKNYDEVKEERAKYPSSARRA